MNQISNQNGRNKTGKSRQRTGSGWSDSHGSRGSTTEKKEETMEFTPHIAGRHQKLTYDTVKEHILQELQKDLKNGSDIVVNLRGNTNIGIPVSKPKRKIVRKIKTEKGKTADPEDIADAKIEQDRNDMEWQIDLKEWKTRQNNYEENMFKAYTIIFGYCNKTTQNRIE